MLRDVISDFGDSGALSVLARRLLLCFQEFRSRKFFNLT